MARRANPAPAPDQAGDSAPIEEQPDPDVAEMAAARRRGPSPKAAQQFIQSVIAMGEKLTEEDWVVRGRRSDRDRD